MGLLQAGPMISRAGFLPSDATRVILCQSLYLGAGLTLVESILTFGTGQVSLVHFGWIVGASVLISLASLSLALLLFRWWPGWWTLAVAPLAPLLLFSLRGVDSPVPEGAHWSFWVRVGSVVLLALLIYLGLKRGASSLPALAGIQFACIAVPALLFLLRLGETRALSQFLAAQKDTVGATVLLGVVSLGILVGGCRRGVSGSIAASFALGAIAAGFAFAFSTRIDRPWLSMRPSVPSRPNVVVIVLDTARRDAFSLYGSSNPTPALDELARVATVFNKAYATGTYSLPSHASLFSGVPPSRHGAHPSAKGDLVIDPSLPLMADTLRGKGYRTLAFSANPFYLDPWTGLQTGFDFFWVGMRQHFMFWPTANMLRIRLHLAPKAEFASSFWPSAAVFDEVRRVLATERSPFLIFVNVMDAHQPYQGVLSTSLALPLRDRYQRAVAAQDASLGTLIEGLKRSNHWDDTLVVVTSDHGEFFGEHGFSWHRRVPLKEEVLRVPLVVKFPRQSVAQRVDSLITLADLKALIDATIDGEPWSAPAPSVPRVVAESWWDTAAAKDSDAMTSRAIFFGPYKLIENRSGADELYDLDADGAEKVNLLLSPRSPAREIEMRMRSAVEPMAKSGLKEARPPASIPPDALDRLRALGYVR